MCLGFVGNIIQRGVREETTFEVAPKLTRYNKQIEAAAGIGQLEFALTQRLVLMSLWMQCSILI
jgi:hypothetical protein